MKTRKAMAVQLAKSEMVPWVQDGKTSLTTSTTGPQVFQTQHWNKASIENTAVSAHIINTNPKKFTLVNLDINQSQFM